MFTCLCVPIIWLKPTLRFSRGNCQEVVFIFNIYGCTRNAYTATSGNPSIHTSYKIHVIVCYTHCMLYTLPCGHVHTHPCEPMYTRIWSRVGQNHIYTVNIRYFWQGNHQIYGHIRCIHTVLANPTCMVQANPAYLIILYLHPYSLPYRPALSIACRIWSVQ